MAGNYALQFDGSQNYLSLGSLGSFGSNMGSGFYCQFQIQTTSTANAYFGAVNNMRIIIGLNRTTASANTSGIIRLQLMDTGSGNINVQTTSATNFNDGNIHTLTFLWAGGSATTVTISVDGVSQALTYANQTALSSFANFSTALYMGAAFNSGATAYLPCTLDNLYIGTSSSSLYGEYYMNEGTGTTTADSSGNGNTATLAKGAGSYPSWVTGLGPPYGGGSSNFLVFM